MRSGACHPRLRPEAALDSRTQRLEHDRATELTTTLGEIAAITRLRLDRLVSDVSHAASHGESIPS